MKMKVKPLLAIGLSGLVLGVSGSALAQKVGAPPAIDNASVFAPAADITMSTTRSYNQAPLDGEPVPTWFGLWALNSGSGLQRRSYVTFDETGLSPVQSATLYLYDYYYEGFANPGWNVTGTATVRGIGGQTFTEINVGVANATVSSSSILRQDNTTWDTLGTFTMSGSDGSATVPGAEVGWYAVDVTSFWNANVGQNVVMSINFTTDPNYATADGPIFEDAQGTAFANGSYGAIANSGPRVVTVPQVPEPTSLALLALGGLLALIRRR